MTKPGKNRNWLRALSLLALFLVGDRVGGYIMDRAFQSTRFRFSQVYSGDLPADLVFIGNSRGVHMFHRPPLEAISGQRVANISFNGMPAPMMPVIWNDYLEHHKAPSKVFVEVSCIGRDNEPGSLERFAVLMAHSPATCELMKRSRTQKYWWCQVSHLYRFNSELHRRSLFFLRNSDQDWIMDGQVPSDWHDPDFVSQHGQFQRSQDDVEAISKLIAIANQAGVEVELILAPYLPAYQAQLPSHAEWLAWLESELGQPIHDYSSALPDSKSFADPIHLNPEGAKTFASFLNDEAVLAPTKATP
ncbi:hypothetical protein SAMN06265222_11125 [Neorhodopirellula lusitana]|uniref:SGNH/GDSL hydrolase family protein n=1 Tax=Neorhodopirellula lusitana TaxID=445327 RepID=A0ABY1QHQ2_9BACT|nr:hypothetical protein SAMN06265222_11125 [Neorhodopirellula lusitana]